MASLYISYFGGVENNCAARPAKSETVTTSGTSAQGAVNTDGAAVVSLFSTAAHWVTVGSNPTATATNGFYLPASTLMWLDMDGLGNRLAAITA